jgi:hypothetical protein
MLPWCYAVATAHFPGGLQVDMLIYLRLILMQHCQYGGWAYLLGDPNGKEEVSDDQVCSRDIHQHGSQACMT